MTKCKKGISGKAGEIQIKTRLQLLAMQCVSVSALTNVSQQGERVTFEDPQLRGIWELCIIFATFP